MVWQDGKWKKLPKDIAEWTAVQFAAMERVIHGTRCDSRTGCTEQAIEVISDARPWQDPFHATCDEHGFYFIVVWPADLREKSEARRKDFGMDDFSVRDQQQFERRTV